MKLRKYKKGRTLSFESEEEYLNFVNFLATCFIEERKIGYKQLFGTKDRIFLRDIKEVLGYTNTLPDGVQNVSSNLIRGYE